MAIGLLWLLAGQRIWRFVTGQDLIEQVAVEPAAEDVQPEQLAPTFVPQGDGQMGGETVVVERAPDPFTDIPQRDRRQVWRYEVQSGDTIFGLADSFDLDPNTIFWANTETLQDNIHLIQIGLPLYILPGDGVYHTASGDETLAEIAESFGVALDVIVDSSYNHLLSSSPDYVPPEGQRLVVSGGTREYLTWSSPIVLTGTSDATSPEALDLHPGACRAAYTGAGGTGNFIHPLGSEPRKVTTGFYPWHPGVDVSADTGTPVAASDTGVVVFAGRHTGGYGTLVILDHGNGFTTYYAHLNARFVECGQSVAQGATIGEVGATGATSGAHIHFEVRKDHRPQTPYLYFEIPDIRVGT